MNDITYRLAGQEHHLLFNGFAMFAEKELLGGQSIVDIVEHADGADGIRALAEAFCLLAEQGELARRYAGFEPQALPEAEAVAIQLRPVDLPALRQVMLRAVLRGYGREVQAEEVDLGLAELQKKRN